MVKSILKITRALMSKRALEFIGSTVVLVIIIYLIVKSGKATYSTLNQNATINTKNDCVFIVAASWCGHCIKLKESGELDKLNKDIDVIVIPHDHPKANSFMERVGGKGFPTIVVNKFGELHKYDGPRNSTSMFKFYKQL